MPRRFASSLLLALPLGMAAPAAAQRLVVHRAPGDSVVLDAPRLAALPRETVRGRDHGRDATFEGTPLRAVLSAAGIRTDSLRGAALTEVLVAEATDGYRIAIALSELSPDLGARAVLVADRRDGAPLSATEGPLRLVVATDGRPARWIRQVTTLRIVRVPSAR
ncbi:MAG: molybdopterin-dependent oxidoreductase [Gemmatimonadaceae bacterium]|jgi:hypothetical protein|nr:molybdopterin-dependent oxidoreductase [Gemmatimonadaceae bacterium]